MRDRASCRCRPARNVALLNALAGRSCARGARRRRLPRGALRRARRQLAASPASPADADGGSPAGRGRAPGRWPRPRRCSAPAPRSSSTGLGLVGADAGRGLGARARATWRCSPAASGGRAPGLLPLRGQNNVQGNADMGASPDLFTGYQPLDDPERRARGSARCGARRRRARRGLTAARDARRRAARRAARALGRRARTSPRATPTSTRVVDALGAPRPARRPGALPDRDRPAARTWCCPPPAGSSRTAPSPTPSGASSACAPRLPPAGRGAAGLGGRPRRRAGARGATGDYRTPADVSGRDRRARRRRCSAACAPIASGDGLQWPCPDPEHPGTPRLHLRAASPQPGAARAARFRREPRARRGRLPVPAGHGPRPGALQRRDA